MKRQRIKYLRQAEKDLLLRTLKLRKDAARAYAMYSLMLSTGLRLSETANLNIRDVLDRTKLEINGKGNKIREVPLNKAMRTHIAQFLRWKKRMGQSLTPNSPLFMSRNHRRISPRQIQRDLMKWIREAGIEGNFSPHALRHTVGTQLMRTTKNIRLVQEYLGHSDISTTQIYTHVTNEELSEASELLAP